MNRKTIRFILAVSAEHRTYNNALYNNLYYIQTCSGKIRTKLSDSLHRILSEQRPEKTCRKKPAGKTPIGKKTRQEIYQFFQVAGEKEKEAGKRGEGHIPLLTCTVIHSTGYSWLIQRLAPPYRHCLETRVRPAPILAAGKYHLSQNFKSTTVTNQNQRSRRLE